jgi:hypothetical protein
MSIILLSKQVFALHADLRCHQIFCAAAPSLIAGAGAALLASMDKLQLLGLNVSGSVATRNFSAYSGVQCSLVGSWQG